MRWFMLGYGAVLACVIAASIVLGPRIGSAPSLSLLLSYRAVWAPARPSTVGPVAALVLMLPAAWAAASAVQLASPRRMFYRRVGGWFGRCVAGGSAGVISVVLIAAGLPFADGWMSDGAIVCAGAAVGTLAVTAWLMRRCGLHCVRCGYDLRGNLSPTNRRCPECGGVDVV